MALDLPAGLVPCVRETALLLYGAAVEALHLALTEAGDAGVDVRRHDERVRRLSGAARRSSAGPATRRRPTAGSVARATCSRTSYRAR